MTTTRANLATPRNELHMSSLHRTAAAVGLRSERDPKSKGQQISKASAPARLGLSNPKKAILDPTRRGSDEVSASRLTASRQTEQSPSYIQASNGRSGAS